jgi:hypothetical protein
VPSSSQAIPAILDLTVGKFLDHAASDLTKLQAPKADRAAEALPPVLKD